MRAATLTLPPAVRLTPTVRRKRWWLSWRLWVIALDAILLSGYFAIQKWPLVKIHRIDVEGPSVWESRVRSQIFLPADSNLFSLDLDNLQSRLQGEFGSLADCRAQLLLPDRLLIQVAPTPLTLWTEGGMGVGVDGSLLVTPAVEQPAPIWRSTLGAASDPRSGNSVDAAGAWSQVLDADSRFINAVSEWGYDPAVGWTMVGANGQTRMIVGSSDLTRRAAYVSALLARPDSILAAPCAIDARFDGQLVVSRLASLDDTASVADSGKAIAPKSKVASPPKDVHATSKLSEPRPLAVVAGDSEKATTTTSKILPPTKPSHPKAAVKSGITKPTKPSSQRSHKSVPMNKSKSKNARRGGA